MKKKAVWSLKTMAGLIADANFMLFLFITLCNERVLAFKLPLSMYSYYYAAKKLHQKNCIERKFNPTIESYRKL